MRRLFFIVLMGCTSLVGVGDLTAEETCGSPGPENGLLAYYPLDEDAGPCAKNCVDEKFPACTPDGAPAMWSTNIYWRGGSAIQVTPNGGCVHILGLSNLEQTTFSVSAWIYTSTIPTAFGTIIGRHKDNGLPGWYLAADRDDAGRAGAELHLFGSDGGTTGTLFAPGIALNAQWQHVVMSYVAGDASTVMVGDASAKAALPPIVLNSSELVIGCRGRDDYQFSGYIDEVRIYDHELSPQEISALEQ